MSMQVTCNLACHAKDRDDVNVNGNDNGNGNDNDYLVDCWIPVIGTEYSCRRLYRHRIYRQFGYTDNFAQSR